MPEGHTTHRLARDLRPLVGRLLAATSPQGRFADGAALIDSRVLAASDAYGKHLLLAFHHHHHHHHEEDGDERHLHVHLGMQGAMFRSDPAGTPRGGIRLRLRAEDPDEAWDLAAPTRCEVLTTESRKALLARLGPDPLRGDDPAPVFERVRASGRGIGQLLLDQEVAGVGNVFRAEALHRCRIHPGRAGASLREEELDCLWRTLDEMMRRATDEGRIITVDGPAGVERADIAEADGRFVYKQKPCRTCGGEVRSWDLAGRTAHACETCQPPASDVRPVPP